jgi:predicted ATPase
VPAARVTFIGRTRESARLVELVREVPLVTVTGPGGVGKTTLVAHVADALGDRARWCDLAPVADDGSVAVAVAAALGGSRVAVEDAEAELPALTAGRGLVLVLDNCEHVTAGAAAAVAAIVASPGAHVLATSRESLGLAEEQVFALAPLPEADAVRLFAERAAAVRSGFAIGPGNADDVVRLCRRLDGLPLAVELAAARSRSLSPREIADRLDERFGLLARRKSRAPDRHRSLRAAIDWSYELLDEPERVLLARLGVFSTPVPLGEVELVCGGDPLDPATVLDVLDRLVDRSLVTAREAGGATRYGMLESLREYARERLAERGEVEALHDRHADRYVALAGALRLEAISAWDAVGRLSLSDLEDALTALRWCVVHDDGPQRAFRMLAPLWAVVHSAAAAEITDLAERALARWGRAEPSAVRVLGVAAVGHFVLGQPELARARALEGIAAAGPYRPALIARRALALVVYHYGRELEESDRLLAEVIGVAEQRDAPWIAVEMSALRALVLAASGQVAAGTALAMDARRRAQEAGGRHLDAWATFVLGAIGLGWGSFEDARRALARSLELARVIDFPLLIGGSLRHLGVIAALEGDRAGAAELLVGSLAHFGVAGDRVQRWEVLRSAAIALAAAGERETAERLLAGADAARVARVLAPLERALLDRVLPDGWPAGEGEDLATLTRVAMDALAASQRDAGAATASATPAAPAVPPGAIFRRDGRLWTLAFAGREVRTPHLKGLSDLAALLATPGRAIHCLDLAGDGVAPGDLGEVIDARAREEFRVRADEVQAEIEAAGRANDPVREERARDELTAIADALEAAYGLGGRPRRVGDPAERARTTVAWRIRSALGKLEREHEPLARHLRNAVRTGTWCVYEPETPVDWEL